MTVADFAKHLAGSGGGPLVAYLGHATMRSLRSDVAACCASTGVAVDVPDAPDSYQGTLFGVPLYLDANGDPERFDLIRA